MNTGLAPPGGNKNASKDTENLGGDTHGNKNASKDTEHQGGDTDEGSADGSSTTATIIIAAVVAACVVLGGVGAIAYHYNSKSGVDAEVRVHAQGKSENLCVRALIRFVV